MESTTISLAELFWQQHLHNICSSVSLRYKIKYGSEKLWLISCQSGLWSSDDRLGSLHKATWSPKFTLSRSQIRKSVSFNVISYFCVEEKFHMSYILLGIFFGVLLGGLFLMVSFSYTEQNSMWHTHCRRHGLHWPRKATLCLQTNQPIHVPLINGGWSMASFGPTSLFPKHSPK